MENKAKENEVEAWALVIYCPTIKRAKEISAWINTQDGFLGVCPNDAYPIFLFETENNMKGAYNLAKAKGWKLRKMGSCHIDKKYL